MNFLNKLTRALQEDRDQVWFDTYYGVGYSLPELKKEAVHNAQVALGDFLDDETEEHTFNAFVEYVAHTWNSGASYDTAIAGLYEVDPGIFLQLLKQTWKAAQPGVSEGTIKENLRLGETQPKQLKQVRVISEEDYGPFLQVVTLYFAEGRFHLRLSAGYDQENNNEKADYILDGKPTHFPTEKWLKEKGFVDPLVDQSRDLIDLVGVTGRRQN